MCQYDPEHPAPVNPRRWAIDDTDSVNVLTPDSGIVLTVADPNLAKSHRTLTNL